MKQALTSFAQSKKDLQYIREKLEQHFGGTPKSWPDPEVYAVKAKGSKKSNNEAKVQKALRFLGQRRQQRRANDQKRRDAYWRIMWSTPDTEMGMKPLDEKKWLAWCAFLEIMDEEALRNMYETTGLGTGERDMEPRAWPLLQVATAYTGVLLEGDLADLAEFINWFVGRYPMPEELRGGKLKAAMQRGFDEQGISFRTFNPEIETIEEYVESIRFANGHLPDMTVAPIEVNYEDSADQQ